jgi:hypothetical protein
VKEYRLAFQVFPVALAPTQLAGNFFCLGHTHCPFAGLGFGFNIAFLASGMILRIAVIFF